MSANAWLALLLFMALLLLLSLYGLSASGHFPRAHRAATLQSSLGSTILFGSTIVAALCLVAGLVVAWRAIPWYAAVIGGGLVILATPLVLRPFPDTFVNGRGALLAFGGLAAAIALAMLRMIS